MSVKLQGKTIEYRCMELLPMLSFLKLSECWKTQIEFAMHKNKLEDAIYNGVKQIGIKNSFIDNCF